MAKRSKILYNPKMTVSEGCLDESFVTTYLLDHAHKSDKRKLAEMVKDDGTVEYIRIGFPGFNQCHYDHCWLIEDSILIYVDDINTSSGYSMCMCGMDREYDDDEDERIMSLREFLYNDQVNPIWSKHIHEYISKQIAKRSK